MSRILIVEDSPTEGAMIQGILQGEGYDTELSTNVVDALKALAWHPPDLVLTDLILPEADGLQLIKAIRRDHPRIPSVLFTARGSEEIAADALQGGAAGYILKRRIHEDLLRTVQKLLGLSAADRYNARLAGCWAVSETQFVLDSNPELIRHLVAHYRETLALLQVVDDLTQIRIGVALTEALDNALYHGNFELSSELREGTGEAWRLAAEARRCEAPYKDRNLFVRGRISRDEARFTVRDEGPGFDPSTLTDSTAPGNLDRISGRGVLLMRAFMDEVIYDTTGTQVTLVKRRTA